MMTDKEILEQGMDCLMDNLGIIEAERFVSLIWQERDKYNAWKEEYDNMSDEEWLAGLEEFMRNHPDDKNFIKGESTNEV